MLVVVCPYLLFVVWLRVACCWSFDVVFNVCWFFVLVICVFVVRRVLFCCLLCVVCWLLFVACCLLFVVSALVRAR